MNPDEESLSRGLREDEPAALDPDAIIAGARRRRSRQRVGIATAVASVFAVAGIGGYAVTTVTGGNEGSTSAAPAASAPAASAPAASERPAARPPGDQHTDAERPADRPPAATEAEPPATASEIVAPRIVPGLSVVVTDEEWCVANADNFAEVACPTVPATSVETVDSEGRRWLIAVVPSGPDTHTIQGRSGSSAWVDLRTSSTTSQQWWVGVSPAEPLPPPVQVRAVDRAGQVIWPR